MKPTAYFKNLKKSSETIVSWLNWRKMITFWYCSRIPGRFCNQRISFRSSSLWKFFLQWLGRKFKCSQKQSNQTSYIQAIDFGYWDGTYISDIFYRESIKNRNSLLSSNITLAWFMQFRWQLKTTYSCFYLVNIL